MASHKPVFLFGTDLSDSRSNNQASTSGRGFDLNVASTADDDDQFSHKLRPPHGKPFSSRLPDEFVGDVLQVWELLWRFHDVLGLEVPSSFVELEEMLLIYSSSPALPDNSRANDEDAHCLLLKVLISELQSKVADPTFDVAPINELTWPELARRYILSCQDMNCSLSFDDTTTCKGDSLVSCLRGYSGAPCDSVGEVSVETYALILAKAIERIFGHTTKSNYVWPSDYNDIILSGNSFDATAMSCSNIPEWAQFLEPVRKLRTNVGSRIRKCVYDALEKDPPDWARNILEASICKEVYKANAAGPTKKAVLMVLSKVHESGSYEKHVKGRKGNRISTVTDLFMEQCRTILHRAISGDKAKLLCNMLQTASYPDGNVLESHFETIGSRLAIGAYLGSHEAFLEDVNEVWHNIRSACQDQPDLTELAENLHQHFEELFRTEVLFLVEKCSEHSHSTCPTETSGTKPDDVLSQVNPCDEGVCKVCGIDKDDDKVLLCDTCDSGYHTYCLSPPLARVPKGKWFCPSCIVIQGQAAVALVHPEASSTPKAEKYHQDAIISSEVKQLASTLNEKDHWELHVKERILLLRFLCDEVLGSSVIRRDFEQCNISSPLSSQPGAVNRPDNLKMLSLRRELLGRDSSGRLYWNLSRPESRLKLVVDCSTSVQHENMGAEQCPFYTEGSSYNHECNQGRQHSWVFYESRSEIEALISCLSDSDPLELNLKHSVLQWLTLINEDLLQDTNLVSRDPEANSSKSPKQLITSSLVTRAFLLLNKKYGPCLESEFTFIPQKCEGDAEGTDQRGLYRCKCLEPIWPSRPHCVSCHQTFSAIEELNIHIRTICKSAPLIHNDKNGDGVSPSIGKTPEVHAEYSHFLPQSSLKTISENTLQILRMLKISLLDMEAALPQEALKPSRALLLYRNAWRKFVRSAETICEMMQASVALENMITSEYLKSRCWYWSLLSAGFKTSTMSSLALCIYSLDAAIIYIKTPSRLSDKEDSSGYK